MTLIPLNIYLSNDDSIHVSNQNLSDNEYKQLIRHFEVLNSIPVYINDYEYSINDVIDLIIPNSKKEVTINGYKVEL